MKKCIVCGREILDDDPYYHDEDGPICCGTEDRDCFKEHYWNKRLSDPTTLIINGDAYHVGPEDTPKGLFRGFDGRKFKIILKSTGEIIETTNLWHNGTVPKDRNVQDNAEFVR